MAWFNSYATKIPSLLSQPQSSQPTPAYKDSDTDDSDHDAYADSGKYNHSDLIDFFERPLWKKIHWVKGLKNTFKCKWGYKLGNTTVSKKYFRDFSLLIW